MGAILTRFWPNLRVRHLVIRRIMLIDGWDVRWNITMHMKGLYPALKWD